MITDIIMPKNGMDMTEGVLVKWLKNEGDEVEYEEPLFVVETDKITMESESPAKGILLKKLYDENTTLPVFTVLGYIGEKGDKIPEGSNIEIKAPSIEVKEEVKEEKEEEKSGVAPKIENGVVLATPHAKTYARENNVDLKLCKATGKYGEVTFEDVERVIKGTTPLARAIASDLNKDLSSTTGTGFDGKITKDDLVKVEKVEDEKDVTTIIPMTGMRKVIAKRMLSSTTNIPPVTQNMRIDVTKLYSLREDINVGREKPERITINDFIVKAVAEALKVHDRFRMTFDGDHFTLHSAIDIGVAVSVDEGLLVPTVRNAASKSLGQISKDVKELAKKARGNTLKPDEMGNARITISNLGMYGVFSFTPIVNEPEAAIVGVCATEEVPVLENGILVNKKKMMISVTYDHRILNGSEVAEFQKTIKELLENPVKLLGID